MMVLFDTILGYLTVALPVDGYLRQIDGRIFGRTVDC